MYRRKVMKKGWRFVIAIVIAILVNVLTIGGVLLWCRHISENQETQDNVESTVNVEGQLDSLLLQTDSYFVSVSQ